MGARKKAIIAYILALTLFVTTSVAPVAHASWCNFYLAEPWKMTKTFLTLSSDMQGFMKDVWAMVLLPKEVKNFSYENFDLAKTKYQEIFDRILADEKPLFDPPKTVEEKLAFFEASINRWMHKNDGLDFKKLMMGFDVSAQKRLVKFVRKLDLKNSMRMIDMSNIAAELYLASHGSSSSWKTLIAEGYKASAKQTIADIYMRSTFSKGLYNSATELNFVSVGEETFFETVKRLWHDPKSKQMVDYLINAVALRTVGYPVKIPKYKMLKAEEFLMTSENGKYIREMGMDDAWKEISKKYKKELIVQYGFDIFRSAYNTVVGVSVLVMLYFYFEKTGPVSEDSNGGRIKTVEIPEESTAPTVPLKSDD